MGAWHDGSTSGGALRSAAAPAYAAGRTGTAEAVLRARGVNWFPTAVRVAAFVVAAPPLTWWLAGRAERPVEGAVAAIFGVGFVGLAAMALRLAVLPAAREEA